MKIFISSAASKLLSHKKVQKYFFEPTKTAMFQERHHGGLQGDGVWAVSAGQAQVLLYLD